MKHSALNLFRMYCLVIAAGLLLGCARKPADTVSTQSVFQGAWGIVFLSVQKGNFEAAAKAAVDALSSDYPNREYVMWKWWEEMFIKRADYRAISTKFGHALFAEYDRSSQPRRKIIAEIFGKPDFDLSKSGDELRKLIERPKG